MADRTQRSSSPPPPDAALAEEGPPHGVSLAAYAEISAQIAEQDRPAANVLEAHRLTEAQWVDSTVFWMKRMGDEAAKEGAHAKTPLVFAEMFGRAQDALKPLVPMTPPEWAALTVEIQKTGASAPVLAKRSLSQADYLRLVRHWARTLSTDLAQNEAFAVEYERLHAAAGGGGAEA